MSAGEIQKKSYEKYEELLDRTLGAIIEGSAPRIKQVGGSYHSKNEIKVSGAFIAIGHDPSTNLFKNQINLDKDGYIITKPNSTYTHIPGIFAAGDVTDKIYRQAVTAAGMGCMAAIDAEKFLAK